MHTKEHEWELRRRELPAKHADGRESEMTRRVAVVPAASSRRPGWVEVPARIDMPTHNTAAGSRRHGLVGLLLLASLATVHPEFHGWCLLDRDALAAGEVWRLWTGHLAHFSLEHLLVDALVFALLAAALVRAGARSLGRGLLIGGAALSVSLLLCDSSLARYGGLSGLNALVLGWLAVRWLQAGGRQRVFGSLLLAGAIGKFAFDSVGLSAPSVEFDFDVVPSHLSHWLGLGWGLVLAASKVGRRLQAEPFPRAEFARG